jgi:hypothetical protein
MMIKMIVKLSNLYGKTINIFMVHFYGKTLI